MIKKNARNILTAGLACLLVIPLSSCFDNHTAKEEWKNDNNQHWHECTVEGCDERFNLEDHTFTSWTIINEASCTQIGKKEKECSVCHYKITEDIPMLGHDKADKWTTDDTHHWKECSRCDEILDKAEHNYTEWVVTVEPTCTTKGQKEKECSVCHFKVIEEVPMLGHDKATEWTNNATHHWIECSRCDEILDKAEHTFTEWTVITSASCTTKGTEERTCSVCGYKETRDVQPTGHNKDTYWTYDKSDHWHNCSECNEKLDKAPHTFSDLIIDVSPTCVSKGSAHKICSVCKYREDVELPKDSNAHTYGGYSLIKPSLNSSGRITLLCDNDSFHKQYVELPAIGTTEINPIYSVISLFTAYNEYSSYYYLKKESAAEILVGTFAEGNTDLIKELTNGPMYVKIEKRYCPHENVTDAVFTTYPKKNSYGGFKIICSCYYKQEFVLPKLTPSNYDLVVSDNGVNEYILNEANKASLLTEIKQIFNDPNVEKILEEKIFSRTYRVS